MRLGALLALAALCAVLGAVRSQRAEPIGPPPPDCVAVASIVDAQGERLVCSDALRCDADLAGERLSGCTPLGPMRGAVLALRGRRIDLNRAQADDLRAIPGVGAGMARRIVEARGPDGFCGLESLERVKGLGPKRIEAMAPFVSVVGTCVRNSPQ